jgi:hypothetical protein
MKKIIVALWPLLMEAKDQGATVNDLYDICVEADAQFGYTTIAPTSSSQSFQNAYFAARRIAMEIQLASRNNRSDFDPYEDWYRRNS